MSARSDRQRLVQAQRIAAVKLQRQERERLAAAAAARAAHARAMTAEAHYHAAARTLCDARSLFFADPQHPASETWLISTNQRAEQARSGQHIAADHSAQARAAAAVARQAHERAVVRAEHLETRAGVLGRAIARCAQDRADEDSQDRRR